MAATVAAAWGRCQRGRYWRVVIYVLCVVLVNFVIMCGCTGGHSRFYIGDGWGKGGGCILLYCEVAELSTAQHKHRARVVFVRCVVLELCCAVRRYPTHQITQISTFTSHLGRRPGYGSPFPPRPIQTPRRPCLGHCHSKSKSPQEKGDVAWIEAS